MILSLRLAYGETHWGSMETTNKAKCCLQLHGWLNLHHWGYAFGSVCLYICLPTGYQAKLLACYSWNCYVFGADLNHRADTHMAELSKCSFSFEMIYFQTLGDSIFSKCFSALDIDPRLLYIQYLVFLETLCPTQSSACITHTKTHTNCICNFSKHTAESYWTHADVHSWRGDQSQRTPGRSSHFYYWS